MLLRAPGPEEQQFSALLPNKRAAGILPTKAQMINRFGHFFTDGIFQFHRKSLRLNLARIFT